MDEGNTAPSEDNLESLSRPFLDLLHRLIGLDSTFLTEVREDANELEVMFSDNRGEVVIEEGLVLTWQDTLCKRAYETNQDYVTDAPNIFNDTTVAEDLGIKTYVSVPVLSSHNQVLGTLCGASGRPVDIAPESLNTMRLFSRLIAEQWQRERARREAVARANEAEERLRERALFLAEAEHKLKTPLTIVRGWTEMLEDQWSNMAETRRRDALATIRTAADQAIVQVDDLLEEARAEISSTQLVNERVDVGTLVGQVADELDGASTRHSVIADSKDQIFVQGDQHALWQALWHLGENAQKYSPDGGSIVLRVTTHEGRVIIEVQDEGIGLPADVDVFAPFARSADVKGTPGNGLGLHIVRTLVEAMNGSVTARRRDEGGSTFTIDLPLRK